MQLLLVEDDRKLALQLKKGLEEQGHRTTVAFDGPEGLAIAQTSPFDLFVLDVMLPGLNGLALVRQLRKAGITTPILLLTARDAVEDVVTGLDAGADDYLAKPFSFQVLLARLRALARRKHVVPSMVLSLGDLILDPATHEVKRAGEAIPLTPKEFALLELLLQNAGRVLTRSRLIEAIWGYHRDIENNTVDVLVRQLRAKVEPVGAPKLIQTIRGIGYALREEEAE